MRNRTYVISLDRTPERMQRFAMMNRSYEYERFPAIDGAKLTSWPSWVNRFSPANRGAALSHYHLLSHCVDSDSPICVLEDDAIILSPINVDVDNFCKIGWNFDSLIAFDLIGTLMRGVCDQKELRRLIKEKIPFKRDQTWYLPRLYGCFGMGGYYVTPSGAKKIIELLSRITDENIFCCSINCWMPAVAIDIVMHEIYREIFCNICIPPLCVNPNDHMNSTVQK